MYVYTYVYKYLCVYMFVSMLVSVSNSMILIFSPLVLRKYKIEVDFRKIRFGYAYETQALK